MHLGEEMPMFGGFLSNIARLHFIENEGMAFGLTFGAKKGKLMLSLFRIVAVSFLAWFIHSLIKKEYGFGVLLSFSLILAGAAGNILDSLFYGLMFKEASIHAVQGFVAAGEAGYTGFLYGNVVDMLHFRLLDFHWPEWMPWIGGNRFQFFRPIFNIADSAITIGVMVLLIFNRDFFKAEEEEKDKTNADETIPVETIETSN